MQPDNLFGPGQKLGPWLETLLARHQRELTFRELRRSVKALSETYTTRRHKLARAPQFTRGKQAAFCAYFTPLHVQIVSAALGALGAEPARNLLDLGAGTGAATLAMSTSIGLTGTARLVDAQSWAIAEAQWSLRYAAVAATFAQRRVSTRDVARLGRGDACVAAFFFNELPANERDALIEALFQAHHRGVATYIIEPIARGVAPFWDAWAERAQAAGGEALELRFRPTWPEPLVLLGRAAGLDHRTLTARALKLPKGA